MAHPLVLAVDIGGTKTRIALFKGDELTRYVRVDTKGEDPLQVLEQALEGAQPDCACVAVAGPIHDGRVALTNHAWTFDEPLLADALGCPTRLANDVEAAARGIVELERSGWRQLAGPPPRHGLHVLVTVGTGLGQALLHPDGPGWTAIPTEGGHVDLPVNTAKDAELTAWLHAHLGGHVSAERAVSGTGLATLHAFFRSQGLDGADDPTPKDVSASDTPAAKAALAAFERLLGAHLGNVALGTLPPGGVWLAGGVPRRINLGAELLRQFHGKGRMQPVLERVPLLVVGDQLLPVRGAAALALETLGADPG